MRKILIIGEINEDNYKEFCQQMDEFESESADDIEIELNSNGGNAFDAAAFYSRIRMSPCDVNITVYGLAASAATLVLAAGDTRRMTKAAWVMVHEESGNHKNLTTSQLERSAANERLMETHFNKILEERTGTLKEKWEELARIGDVYLTPAECVLWGLVQEII